MERINVFCEQIYHRQVVEILRLFYDKVIFVDEEELDFINVDIYVYKKLIVFDDREYEIDGLSNVKKVLFDICKAKTFYHPPFGELTGIRPTKPGLKKVLFEENYDSNNLESFYVSRYKVSSKTSKTLACVIRKEVELIKKHNNLNSLFVSIPFCETICTYCTFAKSVYKEELVDSYMPVLYNEIIKRTKDIKIDLIYVGGGTPSSLSIKHLKKLLKVIKDNVWHEGVLEYTFEAGRYDSLNAEKLNLFKDANVTRIALNPQSFHQDTNKKIKRKWDEKAFIEMFHKIEDLGFLISSDLIFGFENESLEDMDNSLKQLLKLEPENLTIHPLAIKKDRKIHIKEKTKSDIVFWNRIHKKLSDRGYFPYYLYRQKRNWNNLENIGFAKEGYECLYNVYMIENIGKIIGCGAGASSLENGCSAYNPKDIYTYIKKSSNVI